MEFKLLECTLRDGGYQVNWDFSEIFVSDYLDLCSNLDIKNIELGFRLTIMFGEGNLPIQLKK